MAAGRTDAARGPTAPAAVAVVIPAYNAVRHLAGTVASVRAQTFRNWELILVNDGSTDSTGELAARLAAEDSRIQVLNLANGGVSLARNSGVAASGAPVIAFLDADDLWSPHWLEAQIEHLRRDGALGVSFAKVELMSPDGRPTGKVCRTPLTPLSAAELLAENFTVTTSNWMVRRSVIDELGGFTDGLNHCEDLEWLLRVRCQSSWRIQAIDRVLTYYRTTRRLLRIDPRAPSPQTATHLPRTQ